LFSRLQAGWEAAVQNASGGQQAQRTAAAAAGLAINNNDRSFHTGGIGIKASTQVCSQHIN